MEPVLKDVPLEFRMGFEAGEKQMLEDVLELVESIKGATVKSAAENEDPQQRSVFGGAIGALTLVYATLTQVREMKSTGDRPSVAAIEKGIIDSTVTGLSSIYGECVRHSLQAAVDAAKKKL